MALKKMAVNWQFWSDVSQLELWKAVALSLNLDPHRLPGYEPRSSAPFTNCQPEVSERIFIARSHFGTGLRGVIQPGRPSWDTLVELSAFRKLGESLRTPWTFPEEFPRAYVAEDSPPKIGSHETKKAPSRRAWFSTPIGDYVVEIQRLGKFKEAKLLFSALEKNAEQADSPFELGRGNSRGALIVRESGKTIALKSLVNHWGKIRERAIKAP